MNAPIARWHVADAATPNASYRVTTETVSRPAAPVAQQSSVVRRAADAIAWALSYPRRQTAMAELSALTDRELADIGLTRAEVRQVFRRDFASDRTRRTF
jgi:uncharacterized protein YjiS (DUF1127 family)